MSRGPSRGAMGTAKSSAATGQHMEKMPGTARAGDQEAVGFRRRGLWVMRAFWDRSPESTAGSQPGELEGRWWERIPEQEGKRHHWQ